MTRKDAPVGSPAVSAQRLVLAGVVLGAAMTAHYAGGNVLGVLLATGALAMLLPSGAPSWLEGVSATGILHVAIACQLALAALVATQALPPDPAWTLPLAISALLGLAALGHWFVREAMPPLVAYLALVALLGALATCWLMTDPIIDVRAFQELAVERLLDGENPYGFGYPNVYTQADAARFYGAGVVQGSRLEAGFPYPPLSLAPSTLGWLAGDVRVSQAVATGTTIVLLTRMRPFAPHAGAAGILLAMSPLTWHVVSQGWTEPFLAVAFAAMAWTSLRDRPLWPMLGVFLGLKQYSVLFVPVLMRLRPNRARGLDGRALAGAFGLAVLVTVPFALPDIQSFTFSVVLWQFEQPFRADSMSWLAVLSDGIPSREVQFTVLVAATGVAAWWVRTRLGRGWSDVTRGCAVVMLAFLLVNKQAFANYYALAASMIWGALSLVPEHGPGTALASESAEMGGDV